MAQLVEQSLLIPEIRGSNPVIGKFYIEQCIEKEAGNGSLKTTLDLNCIMQKYLFKFHCLDMARQTKQNV